MTAAADRVLVVIPTYNELDTLPAVLARLRAAVPAADALVVDDNSPDGTGGRADELAAADPAIRVLHRRAKAGLGAAYLAGFARALADGYDVVVEMDADGSHAPEELPRLLAALRQADLALGSRWVPGGEVRNWSKGRELLSRFGNGYARTALRTPLRDMTGGFRAYRRPVLERLLADPVRSQGYCFQVDLARRAHQAGFRVVEVPITFTERLAGTSKMGAGIVAEALWRVTLWGLADLVPTGRASSTGGEQP
jgi:dolichol-phosphate mannosyltransferase